MRHLISRSSALFAALAVLIVSHPVGASLVNYDNPGDLAANFVLNSGPAGLRFSEAATGGLGGSRAIDISNALDADNTTAIYSPNSFDLSGPGKSVTISQFVLRRDGQLTQTPFIQLGILSDTTERMDNDQASNSYASMILFPISSNVGTDIKVQYERRVEGGSRQRTDAGITATLTSSHWYLFTATFTYDSATSLLYSGSLEDWGTTGNSLLSTVFTVPATSIAMSGTDQVNGDATVWAGYRGYLEGGSELYDNFSATPEPTCIALLALASLGLRRRRLARR